MTEDEMLHCSVYRNPDKVNTITTAGGVAKQYVFRRFGTSGPTEYATFSTGRLRSFVQ
jgi:hypothetical protein